MIFDTIRPQSLPYGGDIHAIEMLNGDGNIIRNSRFRNVSADGVQLMWTCDAFLNNTLIEGNEFFVENAPDFPVYGTKGPGCGENGIDIKCAQGGTIVRGNIVHGFRPSFRTTPEGKDFRCASGSPGEGMIVHENGKNVTFEGNLVYDNAYGLVVSGGAENIVIRNNVFRDSALANADGDNLCKPSSITFGGASNVEVYHNTMVNNKFYLCGFNASNLKFKNNLVVNGEEDGGGCGNCERSNNGWFTVSQSLTGSGDVSGSDPGSVNQTGNDFHLKAGSPVIDKGVNVGVTNDKDGTTRPAGAGFDLGAYEYK